MDPIEFGRSESKHLNTRKPQQIQHEGSLGPQSTLNTDIANHPKAPERLKKIAAKIASIPFKVVEYTAFAGFAIASIPSIITMEFGEGIAKDLGKSEPKGQKLGFQIGALLTAPILVPLAVIGLGAGISASTIKALGRNNEDMTTWLQCHIARRAHDLHEKVGDFYGIDFNQIAYKLETDARNGFAKKCVAKDYKMSFDTFKSKAISIGIPEDEVQLKSAFRLAKVDSYAKYSQPKFTEEDRLILRDIFKHDLELQPEEDGILEKMIDLYLSRQK